MYWIQYILNDSFYKSPCRKQRRRIQENVSQSCIIFIYYIFSLLESQSSYLKSPNPPEYDHLYKIVEQLSSNLPKPKLVSLLSNLIAKVSPHGNRKRWRLNNQWIKIFYIKSLCFEKLNVTDSIYIIGEGILNYTAYDLRFCVPLSFLFFEKHIYVVFLIQSNICNIHIQMFSISMICITLAIVTVLC